MSDPSQFRSWLRRQRQALGLTQDELGERVGYAGQTIRKIEGGQRRPSLQLAARLAEALQLAPAELGAWMAAARATAGAEEPVAAPGPARLPPAGLPVYLTPFVGRERELAELGCLLDRADSRLITLLGPGGVGKTRLAVEAARAAGGFPDGVSFVPLAPLAAPQAIITAIAEAIDLSFSGASALAAQLIGHLRGRRHLLVLDNLEHLLGPDGTTVGLLEQILAQAPRVSVLATSRERLRLPGEWVLEIGGLAWAPPRGQARSADYPARRLFVEHAQRLQSGFCVGPDDEAALATICRMVDGLPLGIELAAAWTRLLSLEEIGQELARDLDGAQLAPGSLPPRHRSLRAVVDHSWRLLAADERRALRRLSVFQGGFTRAAALAVAEADLAALASLADKSLLRRAAGGRYDLHEIIRQYAEGRLHEDPAEQAATRNRHAAYYMELLADREPVLKGPRQASATAELTAEIDNIRAAWRRAVDNGWLAALERAAELLQWFYEYRGWHQEGAALLEETANQIRREPAGEARGRTLGRILGHYGYLAARIGQFERARLALAESQELLDDGGDPVGLARTLVHQGTVLHWMGDSAAAGRTIERGLALATAAGERWVIALAQSWASIVAHALGQHEEAEQLFRAGLAGWRSFDNPRAILWCLTYCSITLTARGKYQEAQQALRESLALSQATDDRYGMAMAMHHLGLVAHQQGEHAEAAYLFRESLPLMRAVSSWDVAQTLNDLGAALWATGARAEAGRSYREALARALEAQALPDALQALAGIAAQLQHEGRYAEALGLAARVLVDPASRAEARRQADEVRAAAGGQLPAEARAAIEGRAGGRPLAALLAELGGPTT